MRRRLPQAKYNEVMHLKSDFPSQNPNNARMCRSPRHQRERNTFTITDIIGTIVRPRKQGWKAELMTVCKHIITKLPYVNSEKTLSNDSEHEYWIYPVFSIPCPRLLSYAKRQLRKPHCEAVVSGETGAIEALGHQQVVCFYSHMSQ